MIETTDFSKSEQYTLSIRLSTDGFSFSVFNPLNGGETSLHEENIDVSLSLTANLKQCIDKLEWLNKSYRRVNIIYASKRYTFVPLEFFEDEQAEEIFHYNHPKRDNEQIEYNILSKNNIVVLFSIDKSAHTMLCKQFPNAKFYAQATPFIDYFTTKSKQGNNRKLYAHLRKEELDLFVYERGRLQLANTFAAKETNDHVYYLLYIWKQMGLDQTRDELHLTGLLQDKSALLSKLRTFIRQVFVINPATNLDLQAIISCE